MIFISLLLLLVGLFCGFFFNLCLYLLSEFVKADFSTFGDSNLKLSLLQYTHINETEWFWDTLAIVEDKQILVLALQLDSDFVLYPFESLSLFEYLGVEYMLLALKIEMKTNIISGYLVLQLLLWGLSISMWAQCGKLLFHYWNKCWFLLI